MISSERAPQRGAERCKFNECLYLNGKGRHIYKYCCVGNYFSSITVQRIRMKFCVSVATNSDCVSLSLGFCSLFTFGVGRFLLHRFDAPFKCTMD